MPALSHSAIAQLVLAPLILWRMVTRVRRLTTRQQLTPARPRITLYIFPTLLLLLGREAWPDLDMLALLLGSAVAGGLFAVFGLKLTRFEASAAGLYYTHNRILGIVLSLLFIGRILYRVVQGLMFDLPNAGFSGDFVSSPLTLAVFGLLAGYYIGYAIGLMRWRFRVKRHAARRRVAGEAA